MTTRHARLWSIEDMWTTGRIKVDHAGCWLWTGWRDRDGYGRIRLCGRHGKTIGVHRLSYQAVHGEIPKGLVLDHLCRNKACVNPAHLEAVTDQTNILRGYGLAATNAQATTCPQGHPYDLFNTYTRPNGKRKCRACDRAAAKVRYYLEPRLIN